LNQARESAEAGVEMKSKAHERNWRLNLLERLYQRIEIGRYEGLDVTAREQEYDETLARINELLKIV